MEVLDRVVPCECSAVEKETVRAGRGHGECADVCLADVAGVTEERETVLGQRGLGAYELGWGSRARGGSETGC